MVNKKQVSTNTLNPKGLNKKSMDTNTIFSLNLLIDAEFILQLGENAYRVKAPFGSHKIGDILFLKFPFSPQKNLNTRNSV
jgi:hypothetical protein